MNWPNDDKKILVLLSQDDKRAVIETTWYKFEQILLTLKPNQSARIYYEGG